MSRQVLPHPPSPTTTNFYEYAGGWVMIVASDILSVDTLVFVLADPLLALMLWLRLRERRAELEEW